MSWRNSTLLLPSESLLIRISEFLSADTRLDFVRGPFLSCWTMSDQKFHPPPPPPLGKRRRTNCAMHSVAFFQKLLDDVSPQIPIGSSNHNTSLRHCKHSTHAWEKPLGVPAHGFGLKHWSRKSQIIIMEACSWIVSARVEYLSNRMQNGAIL